MQSCKLFGTSRLAGGFLFIQKNPLFPVGSKFMAERGRFELPVPFEYTRFPIVLYRIRYNTAAQTRRTNTKEYYILFQYIMINKFSTLTAMTHLIIW